MTPNFNLLRILDAVAEAEEQDRSVLYTAGLDTIDLMHFLAVASEMQLIEPISSAPQYRLTLKGLEVAATHVKPLSALRRALTSGDLHHDRNGADEDRSLSSAHSKWDRDARAG